MTAYLIELEPDDNGTTLVTCPAFPEVTTFGEGGDFADCVRHARDAIEEAIAARIAGGADIPGEARERSFARGNVNHAWAELPALTDLKVGLYNALRTQGLTRAEFARRLGWNRNSVDRLFQLDHASRLDQIEVAAAALGLGVEAQLVQGRARA